MSRIGALIAIVAGLMLAAMSSAAWAETAAQLGPAVALVEPSGGFVGKLGIAPARGPVGTPITITGSGLPAGESFELAWRTATGAWKVEAEHYRGREFTPVAYRIATVTAGPDGTFSASFAAPEDFGFEHDIVLQQGDRLLTQTSFSIAMSLKLTPESGPVGTPIQVDVTGIGYRTYENSWTLVYDSSFTGWVSSVTTGGTAHFTIPATGEPGHHIVRLIHAGFVFPYLNPQQSPLPDRDRPQADFQLSAGDAVLPPPPDQQGLAAIRTLPAPGLLVATPAFSPIDAPVAVSAGELVPGKSYELQWGAVFGNRIDGNGYSESFRPVATAVADADGKAVFKFAVPDDLGGVHHLRLDDGDGSQDGTYWITANALPLDVASGPAGTIFNLHIKGGSWTETSNAYMITYDNSYLGYVCAFNSQGDLTIPIVAAGAPGWHYIDLYPGIYKGDETAPNNYRIPQLTYAADHPGEDLPAFHFAFRVTD